MKRKIVCMLVMTLLIATAGMTAIGTTNENEEGLSAYTVDLTVGRCDWFVVDLPDETTAPWNTLLNWITASGYSVPGSRDCDEVGPNQYWAHTFDLDNVCNTSQIVGASLRITICNHDPNDGMALGIIDSNSATWDVHKPLWDSSNPANSWGVREYKCKTVVIDLDLDYHALFTKMVNRGWLDVIVQDDSPVDCAILTIECDCLCELEIDIVPGLYIFQGIQVDIKNIGNTPCNDVYWTITATPIFGSGGCSVTGTIASLASSDVERVVGIPKGFAILRIDATASSCSQFVTDSTWGIVIGPLVYVV